MPINKSTKKYHIELVVVSKSTGATTKYKVATFNALGDARIALSALQKAAPITHIYSIK